MITPRTPRRRRHTRVPRGVYGIVTAWALLLAPLTFWGLPTHAYDRYLFPHQPAWNGQRLADAGQLAALRARAAGADTDLNPLDTAPDQLRILNTTPAEQAEIVTRYRLYSRQPDEMITFRALQRMNPRAGDFDPHLYQYGGAYIYLVGAALGVGHLLGVVTLTGDLTFYLDHPEAFARFYVVARMISLLFGAAALLAVAHLGRRAAGRRGAWIAVVVAGVSPVLIAMAVEAKPHLPSAALLLWATVFALRWLDSGRFRDAGLTGLLAGLAFGFVLTGLVAALLPPAWLLFHRTTSVPRRWAIVHALLLFAGAYALTNPYVIWHVVAGDGGLGSNIGNSTAMYTVGRLGDGIATIAHLLWLAGPWLALPCAALGIVRLLRRDPRGTLVAAAPAVALVALLIGIGAGKPAEYGRFLVYPVLLLSVPAATALAALARRSRAAGTAAVVALTVINSASCYVYNVATDAWTARDSRAQAAAYLAAHLQADERIALLQEPAPYSVPALPVTAHELVLLPPRQPPETRNALPGWLVFTADGDAPRAGDWWRASYKRAAVFGNPYSPITWANKPTFIYRRLPPK